MDIFKQDPLAANPFQNEVPVSQMNRTPPPVDTTVEKGLGQQATEMATNKVMGDALNYGTEEAYKQGASMFATPTMSSVATPLMKSGVDPAIANALAAQTTGATIGSGTAAATTAAGAGGMAALGAAIPYVGMGLLAGKAFGLFNKGGPVYAQEGMPIGPLAIRKIRYKRDGGEVKEEFELSS